MDVVGGAQPSAPDESVAKAEPFDHGSRDGKPDERQPGDAGEVQEERTQGGKRQPDQQTDYCCRHGRPRAQNKLQAQM